MLKLIALTAAAIFAAEAFIMLILEALGSGLPLLARVLLDSTLLLVCLLPTLYFLIFKKLHEQIRLRRQAEVAQAAWSQSLELQIVERTESLRRANEDLLVEVQERARSGMALRKVLNEECTNRMRLQSILDALHDAVVVVDIAGIILLANKKAESLFHSSSYDLHKRSVKDFLCIACDGVSLNNPELDLSKSCQSIQLLEVGCCESERVMLEMRLGEPIEWEGIPAKVLTLCASQG